MSPPLTPAQLLAYALPALPLAIPTVGLYVLLPSWYVENWGLTLWLTGLLLLLARLSDLITDPLIGHWLDRGRPQRFRSFILLGAMLCVPGLLLLVHPLGTAPAASLLVGSMLLYLGWTLVQIPYLSWLTALSRNSYQRTRAASWREGFTLAGLLLSAALPAVGLSLGASTADVLLWVALATLLPGALALTGLLRRTPLPKQPSTGFAASETKQNLWRTLHDTLGHNRPARTLLGSWLFNGIANGVPAVLFPLYISRTLGGDEADRGLLILIYFGAAILSLPLWLALSQRFHKVRIWQGAMLFAVLAFIPATLLGNGDLLLFIPVCVLTGLALGADLALPHALQADVCDWDKASFERERRGLLFACWNGANKLALGIAAMVGLGLLQLAEYLAPAQSPLLLALIYAGVPCVMKVIAVVWLKDYPLQLPATVRRTGIRDKHLT
ncbi:Na+/melibiose symporter-like transporter [Marinobacterium halophilum]|uniref:Na+/melibiose symporter-like transporter n=1 Tax=Marinobacterium halophilum TaxID=267374 RepID=A0A2P8ETS7_9GAMM|nr:MFS transporter [Marinobacterium halophilum]PSL12845.1 Na+/melibiose symporter-like transporter [Marinobacterium halophilum]